MAAPDTRITQDELARIFGPALPIIAVKLLFPDKSEPLTHDELRYVLRAIAAWNTRTTPLAEALVLKEAATAREVFEDYGSKAKEAIDYMEQLLLAALRAIGEGKA